MTRYRNLRRLGPLAGLVAVTAVTLGAITAGATEVCQSGQTPPSPYCTNVPPTAVTKHATKAKSTTAILHGDAGAGAAGGDPTSFFFEYGTKTTYGHHTTPHTLGSCPSGTAAPSALCSTPISKAVSTKARGLAPCTRYHFRIVAFNPDGTTKGADETFKTRFGKPVKNAKLVPSQVTQGQRFDLKTTLRFKARLNLFVVSGHRILGQIQVGSVGPGKVTRGGLKSGFPPGTYTIRIVAALSCGSQQVARTLTVR